jgi:hypothetical protein
VTFLRNCALLLPAAFLLAALSFLLTHGRQDSALSVYPFLGDWFGGASRLPESPQVRFLLQASLLFLAPYILWISLVGLVTAAERGLWGARGRSAPGVFRRTFSGLYVVLFLLLAAVLGASVDGLKKRLPSDVQVAPAAVAAAPFVAAAAAFAPALLAAFPVAGFLKMKR